MRVDRGQWVQSFIDFLESMAVCSASTQEVGMLRSPGLSDAVSCQKSPRFQTDVNLGGVEKLSISSPRPEYGMVSEHSFDASEIGPLAAGLLAPHAVIFVKGWSRAVSLVTVMLCCYECPDFCQA